MFLGDLSEHNPRITEQSVKECLFRETGSITTDRKDLSLATLEESKNVNIRKDEDEDDDLIIHLQDGGTELLG